jgi:hypothetical protein
MEVMAPRPESSPLMRIAESALDVSSREDLVYRSSERARPNLFGKTSPIDMKLVQANLQRSGDYLNGQSRSNILRREHSGDGQSSNRQNSRSQDSIATSPRLRQYAISAPEGSPMETLPAMQTSPSLTTKSPGIQPSLPSIHTQLGSLADGPPPPPPPSTHLPARQPSFTNGSLHSPPQDFPARPYPPPLHSRTSQFPPYPEPSPSSSASVLSPREPFAQGQSQRSMSPPSKFGPRQYSGAQSLASSDTQTPLSASTQTTFRTVSSEPSPITERLPFETERLTLPPLNGSLVGVAFKCDHPGCTASPFQTQYLLK